MFGESHAPVNRSGLNLPAGVGAKTARKQHLDG